MTIIGIDPGLSGGICSISGDKITAIKMPDTTTDIALHLMNLKELSGHRIKIYIEGVHAMPAQGVRSVWTFGQNYGELRGIMTALQIPFETVYPQTWMKAYGTPKKEKKERKLWLKAKAQELFPMVKVTNYNADALLIMEYGRRHYNGKSK